VIDRRAKAGRDDAVAFPRPKFTHRDRHPVPADVVRRAKSGLPLAEFSFSGLKTAVVRALEERGVRVAQGFAVPADAGPMSDDDVNDFCASFQRVVVESLVDRTFEAARQLGARSVGIAGGVSANSRLRRDALARGGEAGLPVFVPPIALSTDNAAMIAAAGLRKIERGAVSALDFNALATLDID
jgi:N6-L-threonylcarbamoyladenine synthase